MLPFVFKRILYMVPTVFIVSVISFAVIDAPPGDYVTSLVTGMAPSGGVIDQETIEAMRVRYGVDQPLWQRYLTWLGNLFEGDLGVSMAYGKPNGQLIAERLPWSLAITFLSLAFIYLVGIPIGVYSATHQYSFGDYTVTIISFIGIATPAFLLALVALYVYFSQTGQVMVGLFSREYQDAPWSIGKVLDLLNHIWIPALVVGAGGIATLVRVVRATMLEELQKPYMQTARAKGLSRDKIVYKYPFRIAMNPVVSTIGWQLPRLIEGELLASLVLGLPTLSPVLLESLMAQDMYLAGSLVFILALLTVVGTLISDLLLAWLDPRIRRSL